MRSYFSGMRPRSRFLAALAVLASAGCEEVQEVLPGFEPALTPRESYVRALESAGLGGTALVSDWTAAGDRALADASMISWPFAEEGYLAPEQPDALSWRFLGRRGQRVAIDAMLSPDAARVFVDVYEVRDTAGTLRHVLSGDSAQQTVVFEPRRNAEFVVRIQPELLRGGRYTVRIRSDAALAFPVQDRSTRNVQSVFGDARDGGARDHHGVDIFAPRGTPVLAAANGTVSRVRDTRRGGKVVWLNDEERGLRLYYAHLDSQFVASGARVQIGDTLGLVGNTGNARTTPPHLHFGVYRRGEGPVDPWWFVHTPDTTAARIAVDTAAFGDWTRTLSDGARLRASPDDRSTLLAELPRHTALRVVGGAGGWFRVVMPDGRRGFISARLTEAADRPLRSAVLDERTSVHALPTAHAAVITRLEPGDAVPVLALFGGYVLVRPEGSPAGWLMLD
jgi:murein DD-endopeptidase MepM/ murein hydrolase activator NlpD